MRRLAAIVVFVGGMGCAELQSALGVAKSAADGAGETLDALALGRAEQIRMKAGEAAKKAEGGDEAAALKALSEAQAGVTLSILRELAEARARCGKGGEGGGGGAAGATNTTSTSTTIDLVASEEEGK